jgi:Cft2 family RNA processing exonuclease
VRFLPLGGTSVGASCYLYELGSTRLLVDCGIQPGVLGTESLPKLDQLTELKPNALIVTHAHSDHLGAVPLLTKLLPGIPVWMTDATARIALPMLSDAAKVATRNGAPLFTEADVVRLLQHITPITPHEPFEIGEVTLTPRPSGHIVGAVGLLLEHRPTGLRVWHTADFNTVGTPTTDAAWAPPIAEPVDTVVSETTYGTLELPARKMQNTDFVAQVKRILGGGGRVLVPTFALGRAQDVLLTLTRQMPGVPVYLDGLTRDITRLYARMPEHLPAGVRNQLDNGTDPFFPPNVRLVEDRGEREEIIREAKPAVILASSGMLSQGVSPHYARAVLREPDSAVLIVGYQDAESAGRRLLEGRDEVTLNGENIPVLSHVERFYLSAHADRLGISQHLSRYPSSRLVLTHGEGGAREAIFDLFRKERLVSRPRVGEWVELAGKTAPARPNAHGPSILKKRGPIRIKRFKTDMRVTREGNRLVVELPEGFDVALTPDGTYRLEAEWAGMAKLKLVQRPRSTVTVRDNNREDTLKEVKEITEANPIDDAPV